MPYLDPYRENDPLMMDPTSAPVTPIIVDPPTVADLPVASRSPNPAPYIVCFIFAILGMWGLMSMNRRGTERAKHVAYVEQKLPAGPVVFTTTKRDSARATTDRMAEDQTRDNMNQLRREQVALDAARLDEAGEPDRVTTTKHYDTEVASVDLTDMREQGRENKARATQPARIAPAPIAPTLPERVRSDARPESGLDALGQVAVLDLDYSMRALTPMTEPNLNSMLAELDSDIEDAKGTARQVGQMDGVGVLSQRLTTLEQAMETTARPLSVPDRLDFTRQATELKDEVSAFQKDLTGLLH